MQNRRKRTEITIETETLIRVRRDSSARREHCVRCHAERVMLSPSAAARLVPITTREIYRCVESGELHFRETNNGQLLICSESLRDLGKERKPES